MLVWTSLQVCQCVDHAVMRQIRPAALMLMPAIIRISSQVVVCAGRQQQHILP